MQHILHWMASELVLDNVFTGQTWSKIGMYSLVQKTADWQSCIGPTRSGTVPWPLNFLVDSIWFLASHRQRCYSYPLFTNEHTQKHILSTMIVVLIQYPVQLKHISPIIISVLANINLTLNVVQDQFSLRLDRSNETLEWSDSGPKCLWTALDQACMVPVRTDPPPAQGNISL